MLATTERGGCCVSLSVFLRAFLAAGVSQAAPCPGWAVRGVTRGPRLSHGSWPLTWPALGLPSLEAVL